MTAENKNNRVRFTTFTTFRDFDTFCLKEVRVMPDDPAKALDPLEWPLILVEPAGIKETSPHAGGT